MKELKVLEEDLKQAADEELKALHDLATTIANRAEGLRSWAMRLRIRLEEARPQLKKARPW